jgi:hypothetical protein
MHMVDGAGKHGVELIDNYLFLVVWNNLSNCMVQVTLYR